MIHLAQTLIAFLWQGALIAGLYVIARSWLGATRGPQFRYLLACGALAAMAIAPIVTYSINSAGVAAISVGSVEHVASSLATARTSWLISSGTKTALGWHASEAGWIVVVWLAGAFGFYVRFLGGWAVSRRMATTHVRPAPPEWQRQLNQLRERLRVASPVRLVVTAAVQVPTVLGWLRPVVLIPAGALTGLAPEFVEFFIAHELAHIRRHDYLVNLIQCAIEAALFYHPAVWWVSNQIREEREDCCDDMVVGLFGKPVAYARALVELESFRPAHRDLAMAANGASLWRRIGRLLKRPSPVPATTHLRLIFATLLLAGGGLQVAQHVMAQTSVPTSSLPVFEVASIKPSSPDSPLRIQFAPGGNLFVSHATLRFLIKIAYDVTDDQIIGGPAWLSSKRFDIQAKPDKTIPGDPETMSKEEIALFHQPVRLRLQRLLAERFQLELRKQSKNMPVFSLVVDRNGSKMKASASVGDPTISGNPGRGAVRATRVDMDTLARFLSEGQTGRPVVNMTGLKGKFDFQLDWTPDATLGPAKDPNQPDSADVDGISIFTALRQQLGIRLEARTDQADTLVVTRAVVPAGN